MAQSTLNQAITIREIMYSIQIKDRDKAFTEIQELLKSELTRFSDNYIKNKSPENPIQQFLSSNIERSIPRQKDTKVYLLNYKERGSLTIEFSILVLTDYSNYRSTRQALDYLVKDTIGDYFEELLERHIPVNVAVQVSENELLDSFQEFKAQENNSDSYKRSYFPVLLASVALFCSITAFMLVFFHRSQNTLPDSGEDIFKEKYYELRINQQVNDAVRNILNNSASNKEIKTPSDTLLKKSEK